MTRFCLILCACLSFTAHADQRPLLSLVIDDLGYSLRNGRAAIELNGNHTYAILPGVTHSKALAQHAHENNKEVILHLPMQSIGSESSLEPFALDETMSEEQLSEHVSSLLSQIPFVRGVNNHMGSYLTGFDFIMRPIMESIHGYNPELYFLDSRTTPESVAYQQALNAGLPSISRDVFLDNENNLEAIRLQYKIWLAKAERRGWAIAIGHPYSNTLKVLQENLPDAQNHFRFMTISELIEARNVDVVADNSRRTKTNRNP